MNAKEMFEEFKKKECFKILEISNLIKSLVPYIKITFSDSGCVDHETYIYLYMNGIISFEKFQCDIANYDLLNKAINKLIEELGW